MLGFTGALKDPADVCSAYARALKKIDQTTDIAGFSALREAYEAAGLYLTAKAFQQPAITPDAPSVATLVHDTPPSADMPAQQVARAEPIAVERESAIEALFHALGTASIVTSAGDRILIALANPLSHDPEVVPQLRAEIADLLRKQSNPDSDQGVYLSLSLRPAVLAVEERYHWLTDFAAFRYDFGQDTLMLDAMIACSGIVLATPPVPTWPPKKGKAQRLFELLASQTCWFAYAGVIACLVIVANLFDEGRSQYAFFIFFADVIVVPILFVIGYLVYAMVAALIATFRVQKERFDDRRVLRRKGIKLVSPTTTFRHRFGNFTQSIWLLPCLFLLLAVLRALFEN